MTAIALTGAAGIVIPGPAQEACRGVAEVAVQRGRQMSRMLASCRTPVMTGRTIVHDTGVIKHGTDKAGGVMADTAILAGCHMSQ